MQLCNPANRHPLLDLVIYATLAKRDTGTGFLEHRLLAARAAAGLLATVPATAAAGQVLRIGQALDLDSHTVTENIADAIAGRTGP